MHDFYNETVDSGVGYYNFYPPEDTTTEGGNADAA